MLAMTIDDSQIRSDYRTSIQEYQDKIDATNTPDPMDVAVLNHLILAARLFVAPATTPKTKNPIAIIKTRFNR